MVELIRTNDLVLIGLVESLLAGAGVVAFVADAHMSALEGSIGAFQRRIMVAEGQASMARRILVQAGLAGELKEER